MAKEVSGLIKLQIKGGAANPAPPVGPALGSKGVNIMEFCKQFNARTQDQAGKVLPVIITVYKDKSFDFVVKASPVAVSIIEAAKIKGGSKEPNRTKVGSLTWDQVREIATNELLHGRVGHVNGGRHGPQHGREDNRRITFKERLSLSCICRTQKS